MIVTRVVIYSLVERETERWWWLCWRCWHVIRAIGYQVVNLMFILYQFTVKIHFHRHPISRYYVKWQPKGKMHLSELNFKLYASTHWLTHTCSYYVLEWWWLFSFVHLSMGGICGVFSKMELDIFCQVFVCWLHLTVIEVLLSVLYSLYHIVLLIEMKSNRFVMLLILSWTRWENIKMKIPFIWINDTIAGKQNR